MLFMLIPLVLRFIFRLFAEAAVSAALFQQKLGIFAVNRFALGLDIRTDRTAHIRTLIVSQTAVSHGFIDNIRCSLNKTSLIGVLDAKNKFAAVFSGNEVGIKRRAKIANVHIACGTGSKPCSNLTARYARFHILKVFHIHELSP